MAVLSSADLTRLRQHAARHMPVNYTKAQANAAFQAIEDYEVGAHNARPGGTRVAAVNTAAGATLSTEQHTIAWAVWADWKAENLGVK